VIALDELLNVGGERGDKLSPGRHARGHQGRGPGRAFETEETKYLLAAGDQPLPEREKIVVTLYYYEGLTLAEIGQVLGVTESRICQMHTKAVLQLRAKLADQAFDEATWRERLAGNAWYVGTDPGSGPELVTGIVAGRHDPSSPPDQRHLIAMWVAPSARGTGLAVDLVEAVARWARADGATELTLGVTAGNDRASGLYLKCGFVATGETFLLDNDPSRPYHLFSRSLDPATS
jgi:GNAT superfamily N-acetyltransferase